MLRKMNLNQLKMEAFTLLILSLCLSSRLPIFQAFIYFYSNQDQIEELSFKFIGSVIDNSLRKELDTKLE